MARGDIELPGNTSGSLAALFDDGVD